MLKKTEEKSLLSPKEATSYLIKKFKKILPTVKYVHKKNNKKGWWIELKNKNEFFYITIHFINEDIGNNDNEIYFGLKFNMESRIGEILVDKADTHMKTGFGYIPLDHLTTTNLDIFINKSLEKYKYIKPTYQSILCLLFLFEENIKKCSKA